MTYELWLNTWDTNKKLYFGTVDLLLDNNYYLYTLISIPFLWQLPDISYGCYLSKIQQKKEFNLLNIKYTFDSPYYTKNNNYRTDEILNNTMIYNLYFF